MRACQVHDCTTAGEHTPLTGIPPWLGTHLPRLLAAACFALIACSSPVSVLNRDVYASRFPVGSCIYPPRCWHVPWRNPKVRSSRNDELYCDRYLGLGSFGDDAAGACLAGELWKGPPGYS